ncbi:MAG: rod shape-determining protein MreD [Ignavibacteria bacterium GWF2_33_9]|nr:MAG: rod shape-determining protein MreD [Ignavibacteria bacterium GWF2_33_9]
MYSLKELQIRNNKYLLYSIYFGFGILFGLMQISFIPLMVINDSIPNLVMLYAIWLVLREGRIIGYLSAFILGMIYDILTLQVVGVSSLSFLFAVLFAGIFYRKDKEFLILSSYRFILIVFIAALISNLIQNIFYLKLSDIDFWTTFIFKWLGNTVYTAVVATIPFFISFRNQISK